MDGELDALYVRTGRESIPPERLLRAGLIQILFSIRSERQLVSQIEYNLLYRWFVGLGMDDGVWNHSTFSANRERLFRETIARSFFDKVLALAEWRGLVSDEHFSVDGTLIEAWASMKSFRRKDGTGEPPEGGGRNPRVDFKGEKRSNDTHASTTDPQARLYRKSEGDKAQLCYLGHALMENRNGLVVDAETTQATGTAEREAAKAMAKRSIGKAGATLGADKGYDVPEFVQALREAKITHHVSQEAKGGAIGDLRRTHFVGLAKVKAQTIFTFAAYNLTRMGGHLRLALVGSLGRGLPGVRPKAAKAPAGERNTG